MLLLYKLVFYETVILWNSRPTAFRIARYLNCFDYYFTVAGPIIIVSERGSTAMDVAAKETMEEIVKGFGDDDGVDGGSVEVARTPSPLEQRCALVRAQGCVTSAPEVPRRAAGTPPLSALLRALWQQRSKLKHIDFRQMRSARQQRFVLSTSAVLVQQSETLDSH